MTAQFPRTVTRGFASTSNPNTAVCLLPGTELVFDRAPKIDRFWLFFTAKAASTKTARFRQINVHEVRCHHDALEFADGSVIPLTRLAPGQTATVVQLPRPRSAGSNEDKITQPTSTGGMGSLIGAA